MWARTATCTFAVKERSFLQKSKRCNAYKIFGVWANLRKYWLPVALIICIALPIVLLCFLDYYNFEGYNYRYNGLTDSFEQWSNTFFNQNFTFDVTWKGRMSYLIFLWFFVIEGAIGWKEIIERKISKRLIVTSLALALIPTVYVLATNFFGLDLQILKIGQAVGIPSTTADNQPWDFLHLFWPLSVEYLVFSTFFISAVFLLYRFKGLKTFSISLTLLAAVGGAYILDTVFPFGVLKPLQEIALPVTATAAALFDILGYHVVFNYPVDTGSSLMPGLIISDGTSAASISVSWACAGIYSLLLYVLIMFVFFKRTNITSFRKLAYFIIGLFGTFLSAVLRIFSIVLVYLHDGKTAGLIFHNTYGELFGFTWIFAFILIIICIERFSLVEKTRQCIGKIGSRFRTTEENVKTALA
jgi:thaumarchaeosortase